MYPFVEVVSLKTTGFAAKLANRKINNKLLKVTSHITLTKYKNEST